MKKCKCIKDKCREWDYSFIHTEQECKWELLPNGVINVYSVCQGIDRVTNIDQDEFRTHFTDVVYMREQKLKRVLYGHNSNTKEYME